MTIGSELYSDLYILKFIERMRKRNNTRDIVLLVIAIMLLFVAGVSNLLSINAFSNLDIHAAHTVMFVILGCIYIIESFILIINFLCCRNNLIVLISIFVTIISLIVGIYRLIDLKENNNKNNYFIYLLLIADFIIIPILIYIFYKANKMMHQQEFVLLRDNNNNQVIIPKYSATGKKNSLLNDLNYKQIKMDTGNIDIGEDDDDSNLLSSISTGNKKDEDDEKAEVLLMDTPGGNHETGEIRRSDDD